MYSSTVCMVCVLAQDQTLVSRRKADYELVTHMYSAVFQAYVDKVNVCVHTQA